MSENPAIQEFHTSSIYSVPHGYDAWQIRNDYPPPKPSILPPLPGPTIPGEDAPWLAKDLDPRKHPEKYCQIVKEYCFEGMINNDMVPQKNMIRDWYHAPWMHPSASGREPLHGLTPERFCPPRELSATQQRTTQVWAVGFYNSAGASVFGGVWANPAQPNWTKDVSFPLGTCAFKFLYTNATHIELPNLVGSPCVEAMIAVQPDDPTEPPVPSVRVTEPQKMRLLQMDIVTRDDRSATGWVWGVFIYDSKSGSGYSGMIPVGLSWGLDPEVTQEAYERGARPKSVWFNERATDLRLDLHGGRPSWGWNDRLNGPADNFISACQSCHATAQWNPKTMSQGTDMVQPIPLKDAQNRYIPQVDRVTMSWFQDVDCGKPLTQDGAISADNSLQLLIGWENYQLWLQSQPPSNLPGDIPDKPKVPVRIPDPRRRQGPDISF